MPKVLYTKREREKKKVQYIQNIYTKEEEDDDDDGDEKKKRRGDEIKG